MSPILGRGKCPVCGKGPVVPVELPNQLCVTKPGGLEVVGGVAAYQCREEFHIFFVMKHDMETENPEALGYR